MNINEKPFPNEHACRIRQPGEFVDASFRRVRRTANGKAIDLIVAKRKTDPDGATVLQAYRYPKGIWSVEQARSHCSAQNGLLFEPASESSVERMIEELETFNP